MPKKSLSCKWERLKLSRSLISWFGLSVYRFIGLSVYRFIGLSGTGLSVFKHIYIFTCIYYNIMKPRGHAFLGIPQKWLATGSWLCQAGRSSASDPGALHMKGMQLSEC